MESLNTGILKDVPVLLPPIKEQRQLLQTIARKTETIRQVMIDAQREVSSLRELRTRLIADVVTGKLDVREAAARLPEERHESESPDEAVAEGRVDDFGDGDADEMVDEVEA